MITVLYSLDKKDKLLLFDTPEGEFRDAATGCH